MKTETLCISIIGYIKSTNDRFRMHLGVMCDSLTTKIELLRCLVATETLIPQQLQLKTYSNSLPIAPLVSKI